MAKSQQTFNKKEKEKKRLKKRKEKLERRQQRKVEKAENGPKSFEDMISYVDEDGNFHSTPPDPAKKKQIKLEDIAISIPVREKIEIPTQRIGKVKFFNTEKGYGFITDSHTNDNLFVHINNLIDQIRENDPVTYEVEQGQKGPNAVRVKIIKK